MHSVPGCGPAWQSQSRGNIHQTKECRTQEGFSIRCHIKQNTFTCRRSALTWTKKSIPLYTSPRSVAMWQTDNLKKFNLGFGPFCLRRELKWSNLWFSKWLKSSVVFHSICLERDGSSLKIIPFLTLITVFRVHPRINTWQRQQKRPGGYCGWRSEGAKLLNFM